jgi:hypothetical protein
LRHLEIWIEVMADLAGPTADDCVALSVSKLGLPLVECQ